MNAAAPPANLAHEAQRRAVRATCAEAGASDAARVTALTGLLNTFNAETVSLGLPVAARFEIIARTLALNADVSAGPDDALAQSLFNNTLLLARAQLSILRAFRTAPPTPQQGETR